MATGQGTEREREGEQGGVRGGCILAWRWWRGLLLPYSCGSIVFCGCFVYHAECGSLEG